MFSGANSTSDPKSSVNSDGKKKRQRNVVVCSHCRKRKIKCDKQKPCSNCVKLNMGSSCTYDRSTDQKPGWEYTMELSLPLNQNPPLLQAAEASKGYMALFALDKSQNKRQKMDKSEQNAGNVNWETNQNMNEAVQNGTNHTTSTSSQVIKEEKENGNIESTNRNSWNIQGNQNSANIQNAGDGSTGNHNSNVGSNGSNQNVTSVNSHARPVSNPVSIPIYPASSTNIAPPTHPVNSVSSSSSANFANTNPVNSSVSVHGSYNGTVSNTAIGNGSGVAGKAPQGYASSVTGSAPLTLSNKSEIEMLKERLNQIERSLLGSAPRSGVEDYSSSRSMPPLQLSERGAPLGYLDAPLPYFPPQVLPQVPQNPPPAQYYAQVPPVPQYHIPLSRNPSLALLISQLGQNPGQHSGSGLSVFSLTSPGIFGQQSREQMLPPLSTPGYRTETPLRTYLSRSEESGVPSSIGSNDQSSSTTPSQFLSREEFLLGTNIYAQSSDTMNFYEKYSSVHYKDPLRRINFGPFAWSSLMRRDNGLRLVGDYIVEQKGKTSKDEGALVFAEQTPDITPESTNTILGGDKLTDTLEKQFQKRALQTDGYDDLIPYNSIIKARQERNLQKQNLNRTTLPLGLTFYDGQIDRELQLIEKIKCVLPKRKVIWKLIYRYFNYVYSYMPFLDEDYFRRDVARIIGPVSYEDEPVKELKIECKLDLAIVGILLCVLRLSYLSLFSNNSELNEQILNSTDSALEIQLAKYLMQNPINMNTIDVAQLCLDQFQICRRANFTVMQLTLYLRIYHIYAPEDGDGADCGDSQVLSAVLILMAYALGLNREPDEQCKDLKINSLSRKIWHHLMMTDVFYGFSFGNPMFGNIMYSDTKAPFYVQGGENLIDKDKDRFIMDNFSNDCMFLFSLLSEVVKLTLNVRARVPVPELCRMISHCETEWHSRYGSLKDGIACSGKGERFQIERNIRVKVYLAFKTFLVSIFYHMYIHYEPINRDVSFFYLKKMLLITTADIMPHYSALLGKSEVITDMIINPTVESVIHKANMVYLSAMVRINFVIFHMRQNDSHDRRIKDDPPYLAYFQLLCQLSSCLTRAAEYTICAISKISNRYYYAWRITKGQTLLLKIVTSTKFYEENYHNGYQLYSLRFTLAQLEDLIKLCENTLSKFRYSEFRTYGFSKHADKHLFKNSPADSIRSDGLSLSTNVNPSNIEIDKLWLQVLSMKHDQLLAGGEYQESARETPIPLTDPLNVPRPNMGVDVNTPGISNIDRLGYDIEMANKFDLFSDMPFDQIFNF